MYEWYCICIVHKRPDGPPNGVFGPFVNIEDAIENSKNSCSNDKAKHLVGKGPLPAKSLQWLSNNVPFASVGFYSKYPQHRPWYLKDDFNRDWDEIRRRGGDSGKPSWRTDISERYFEEHRSMI